MSEQSEPSPETGKQPPEPSPEKPGKLPEWASITAVVTVITVFAFATSSFYVRGLADELKMPLAIYFSSTDYLRITPGWAIPTLGLGALIGIVFGVQVVVQVCLTLWHRNPVREVARVLPRKGTGLDLESTSRILGVTIIITLIVFYLGMMVLRAQEEGKSYGLVGIPKAPLTRVLFESEKDKVDNVEGKIIFDLERYLLLLTESKSVVAIPHEKIKSIQTPPLPVKQKIGGD